MHVGFDAPEFVIEHADTLLELLPSRRTLKVVLAALNNANQWQTCLDTLDKYRGLLPDDGNSTAFLFFEFEALFQTGRFSNALNIVRQVARHNPSKDNIITWFDKAAQAGNNEHMIEAAQAALQGNQRLSEHLLHMADHLAPVHAELALQLFRAAATMPQFKTPRVAAYAFLLASRLGITEELDPAILQAAVSPEGPMKAYTFEQTIELMQQQQKARAEQEEQYRLGHVYVHGYANASGYPISAIYHDACPPAGGDYFAAPTRLWSARIRHGRRCQFAAMPPSEPWKLHLDVTSLLLAHRLGMLPVLEKSDAQISFSPRVPGLLLEEMKKLNERQPSREKEVDQLLALIDAGRIRVTSQSQTELPEMSAWASGMTQNWRQAFSTAVEAQGVLIDFWPLDWDFEPDRPLEVPVTWQYHVGGPSGLVRGMIEAGWIEEADIVPKIHSHSTFVPPSPSIHLVHGTTVILDIEIARSLIGVGALEALLSSCKVWVTYEEEQRCREARRQAKYQDEIFGSVDTLQKHLHLELGRRFQRGPTSGHDVQDRNDSLSFRSLHDFTAAGHTEGIILVSEDRWMTGFLNVDKAPIVGLLDVLFWIYQTQKLTASNFFGSLHRLRLGNARYIPICKEELLFRLKGATNLHTRRLQETPELEVIRRYYAACFLDSKSLYLGDVENAEGSELQFLTQTFQVAAVTLASLWLDEEDSQIREVKALWILHALVTDVANLAVKLLNPQAESVSNERELEDLFCLFCCQIDNGRWSKKSAKCISSFASWLILTLKLPRSAYSRLFKAIQGMVDSFNTEHPQQEEGCGVERMGTRLILALLPEGQDYLPFTQAEKERFGIVETMGIGGVSLERKEAWDAISLAMKGETALIVSGQGSGRVEYRVAMEQTRHEVPIISFDKGTGDPLRLQMDLLYLASSDLGEQMTFLQSKRAELDLTPERAASILKSIVEVEDPVQRADQFALLDEQSTTSQFKRFTSRRRGSTVTFKHIEADARPLGCASLLRHAGLEPGDLTEHNLAQLLADKAPRLIEDYGLLDGFVRQASLPVKLPNIWSERLFSLRQDDLEAFITSLEDVTASPLLRLQFGCMLLRPESLHRERGMAILEQLIGDDARDAWSFFRAVLQWSWRCLVARSEACSRDEMILCAWLHAGVFQFRLPRPVHSPGVVEAFECLEDGQALLFKPKNDCLDVAHPLHFSAKWLLAHALPKHLLLDELPPDSAESLTGKYRSMLFPATEAPRLTASALVLREGWTNALGSFLTPSSSDELNGWVTDDQKMWLDQEVLLATMRRLSQDTANSASLSSWTFLSQVLNAQAVPESLQVAVQVLLEAFNFSKLQSPQEPDVQILWAVAHFVFAQRQWYRTNDDDYWMNHLNEWLAELEKHKDSKHWDYALDCVFVLSSAWVDDPVECAKRFADNVIQIIQKRPVIATNAWMAMSSIVQSQTRAIQALLWPMLAEVRALATRQGL
jgi:hypothetical protein